MSEKSVIDQCQEHIAAEAANRERVLQRFRHKVAADPGATGALIVELLLVRPRAPCPMQANRRLKRRRRKAVNAAVDGEYRKVLRLVRRMIRARGYDVKI